MRARRKRRRTWITVKVPTEQAEFLQRRGIDIEKMLANSIKEEVEYLEFVERKKARRGVVG